MVFAGFPDKGIGIQPVYVETAGIFKNILANAIVELPVRLLSRFLYLTIAYHGYSSGSTASWILDFGVLVLA